MRTRLVLGVRGGALVLISRQAPGHIGFTLQTWAARAARKSASKVMVWGPYPRKATARIARNFDRLAAQCEHLRCRRNEDELCAARDGAIRRSRRPLAHEAREALGYSLQEPHPR